LEPVIQIFFDKSKNKAHKTWAEMCLCYYSLPWRGCPWHSNHHLFPFTWLGLGPPDRTLGPRLRP
jgi:hypothetical protein